MVLMIQAMHATVLLAAVYALWRTRQELSQAPLGTRQGRTSLARRAGLFAAGIVVTSAAYASADHLVWPALKRAIGPPVITDVATPSLVGQEIISTLLAFCVFAICLGTVVGRRKPSSAMDGHWLLNPLTSALGLVAYIQTATNVSSYIPAYFYWGLSMKFLQVFCIPVVGARAYCAAASISAKP